MAPISLLVCYNCSWSKLNSTYTKLGEFSTNEDIGAATPVTGNDFTITGLVSGSVYWLQVISADGENSTPNTVSLSGLSAVEGSTSYYHDNYSAILTGFYKVTGDPVVTIVSGSSSTYNGVISILISEANSS